MHSAHASAESATSAEGSEGVSGGGCMADGHRRAGVNRAVAIGRGIVGHADRGRGVTLDYHLFINLTSLDEQESGGDARGPRHEP